MKLVCFKDGVIRFYFFCIVRVQDFGNKMRILGMFNIVVNVLFFEFF